MENKNAFIFSNKSIFIILKRNYLLNWHRIVHKKHALISYGIKHHTEDIKHISLFISTNSICRTKIKTDPIFCANLFVFKRNYKYVTAYFRYTPILHTFINCLHLIFIFKFMSLSVIFEYVLRQMQLQCIWWELIYVL